MSLFYIRTPKLPYEMVELIAGGRNARIVLEQTSNKGLLR
jgi:hypothetical protein